MQPVSSPPPASGPSPAKMAKKVKIPTTLVIVAGCVIAGFVMLFCVRYCLIRRPTRMKHGRVLEGQDGIEITNEESLQYPLVTIESATKKFSSDNKLGRGGFGEVYKVTVSIWASSPSLNFWVEWLHDMAYITYIKHIVLYIYLVSNILCWL
uniref:Cysteine-rich receptor-like protein kinase 25 n=1 Tax=Rhizophora mucronata TaxID=61149 RepID=A0A2P2MVM0_RHIMU